MAYDGVRGIEISATFGTPEYLESVFPPNEAAEYVSGSRSVFIVQEISASDALPVSPPALELEVGGKVFRPSQVEERFSSEQQRMNIYTYPASAGAISTATEMALVLPAGSKLIWELVDGKPIR